MGGGRLQQVWVVEVGVVYHSQYQAHYVAAPIRSGGQVLPDEEWSPNIGLDIDTYEKQHTVMELVNQD